MDAGDEDHEDGLTEADRGDMVAALLQRETLRLLTVLIKSLLFAASDVGSRA